MAVSLSCAEERVFVLKPDYWRLRRQGDSRFQIQRQDAGISIPGRTAQRDDAQQEPQSAPPVSQIRACPVGCHPITSRSPSGRGPQGGSCPLPTARVVSPPHVESGQVGGTPIPPPGGSAREQATAPRALATTHRRRAWQGPP